MITFRSLSRLAVAVAVSLTSGIAVAQHDVGSGGGATKDVATSESTGRSSAGARRSPVRAPATARRPPRTPVRRGTTAEQYNQQGNGFFDAKQYDDALEAYEKAVQLKPIAAAYYHIGWIYNDRDNYDQAITALQQAVRYNANDEDSFYELGYAYRN